MIEANNIYHGDCIETVKQIPDGSIDCILTDPPYLYLKNQKLDRPFDETAFFGEAKRMLKKDGFIVLFGRGTSFYRWNTMLADLEFNFKEEIVWNKSYCTSPLMRISRIHETISIHTKKNGAINKVKVPYLEMKGSDIEGMTTDIKRLKTCFGNTESLNAVLAFLENNCRDVSDGWKANHLSISSDITKENRSVSVIRSIRDGMNEKSIIRTDRRDCDTFTKYGVNTDRRKSGNRSANVMQSIAFGMNEKTIIKQAGDHYAAIHPTQKPVRLLERLLSLVTQPGDTILDPFCGSGSTAIACINSGRQYIGIEIDREYYNASVERVNNHLRDKEKEVKQYQLF
jgi:site-specific DNA-methyltransferase (adenine-specific)